MFVEHERKPAVRIRGYVEEVAANLSDDRLITQSITQVAAIRACENKSGCNQFPTQPSLMRVEKVQQPNQP